MRCLTVIENVCLQCLVSKYVWPYAKDIFYYSSGPEKLIVKQLLFGMFLVA